MDFHLETLSSELQKRTKRNPRYSLRAFAKNLELHVSALSRVLAGKQLLSAQASLKIVEKLRLSADEKRSFVNSVLEAQRRQSRERVEQSVATPWLEHERVEVSTAASPAMEQVFGAAVMELALTKDFVWDAEWISNRLQLPVDWTREMMQSLLKSGMLVERDGKIVKAHRDTKSDGSLADERCRAAHTEILKLTEHSLKTRAPLDHTQFTQIVPINPEKIQEARRRILNFLDEMSDLLQTGERTEVYALGLQFFPLTQSAAKPNAAPVIARSLEERSPESRFASDPSFDSAI